MGGRPTRHGPVAQLGARLNGIQEVTGSIPVRSTTLRSPAFMSELRVASHPSHSIAGEGHPSSRARSQTGEGCPPERLSASSGRDGGLHLALRASYGWQAILRTRSQAKVNHPRELVHRHAKVVHHSGSAPAPAATVTLQAGADRRRSQNLRPCSSHCQAGAAYFSTGAAKSSNNPSGTEPAVTLPMWAPGAAFTCSGVALIRTGITPASPVIGAPGSRRTTLAAASTLRAAGHGRSMSSCSSPTRNARSRSSATLNRGRAVLLPDAIFADVSSPRDEDLEAFLDHRVEAALDLGREAGNLP